MDSIDNKHIGKKLRDRRLQLGYTQELAAEKSGISYSYYTKIERGEQLPSIEICVHLAKTFNLSLDYWLLGASPDSRISPEMLEFLQSLKDVDSSSLKKVEYILQKAELLTE